MCSVCSVVPSAVVCSVVPYAFGFAPAGSSLAATESDLFSQSCVEPGSRSSGQAEIGLPSGPLAFAGEVPRKLAT